MNLHDIENELVILRSNIDTYLEEDNQLEPLAEIALKNISVFLYGNQVSLIELMRREAEK